jgi:hypothetical protein
MLAAFSLRNRLALTAGNCMLALLAAVATPVLAQVHEVRQGQYVVRTSTVVSTQIDAASASRHGIEPASDRAVLNVVVLGPGKGTQDSRNMPARVAVTMRRPTGNVEPVEMREVRENNMVNYLGTYQFAPREIIHFEVHAQPQGSTEDIKLVYSDRMWAP